MMQKQLLVKTTDALVHIEVGVPAVLELRLLFLPPCISTKNNNSLGNIPDKAQKITNVTKS